ncbi:Phenylacetaldehyde dehydrogenase [Marinomonas spartinae]|uniref:Phenylacetaldehyde dehydrogenase n=1 Tax=Marinomonas spartinae TaxID=1792290 RepID=A0A1A8TU01_9GAMM|nr:aldehyde dehydrogenase family protein [Marinomonas spartinae]SBS37314.1 Phenylacetaldehyde dehydrogenase [Marinomonas spartinae]
MSRHFKFLINGEWVEGNNAPFNVINPATLDVVATCANGDKSQLEEAVQAAQAAFKSWSVSSHEERKSALNKAGDELEERAREVAELIVAEQGKPLPLAMGEVEAGVAWLRYAASQDIPVEVAEETDTKRIEIHRKPLGVVASITPWNWPLMIAIWHIIPAIRAGNTVVNKPSGLTPLSTIKLVEIINNHLPKGVINIITGERGIGSGITSHPQINKIVFTGSTETGQSVMRNAADNLKRLTLELGGNDAAIVLKGTDVAKVAPDIFAAAFLNMGQTCGAIKRLYVHESIYDDMCAALVAIANEQVVGNGMDEGVNFGPVQNKDQLQIIVDYVEDARKGGATILTGGQPLEGAGYFYPPTLVADIANDALLVKEEQFGPALPIVKYSDVNDAIDMANGVDVGLDGSVWGPDTAEATALASRLECGTTFVNTHAKIQPNIPMGGCKMSGFGVEFGEEGLLEFTSLQVVHINK